MYNYAIALCGKGSKKMNNFTPTLRLNETINYYYVENSFCRSKKSFKIKITLHVVTILYVGTKTQTLALDWP